VNTQQLIEAWPYFSAEVRDELKGAIATKGKWKGFVLASKPSLPSRAAAWSALMANLCPGRAGVYSMMLGKSDRVRAMITEIDKNHLNGLTFLQALNAVEPAFRWNMWALRNDREKVMDYILKQLPKT